MKTTGFDLKKKFVSKYLNRDLDFRNFKSTNVNILLNRVKLNQKNEKKKKIYFSAAVSSCLILFGILIFQ